MCTEKLCMLLIVRDCNFLFPVGLSVFWGKEEESRRVLGLPCGDQAPEGYSSFVGAIGVWQTGLGSG